MTKKKYISVAEYADREGLTRQGVYYRIRNDTVAYEKIAGRYVIIVKEKKY